jgi:hypothetical protein
MPKGSPALYRFSEVHSFRENGRAEKACADGPAFPVRRFARRRPRFLRILRCAMIGGERSSRGEWRTERNWDPTFSILRGRGIEAKKALGRLSWRPRAWKAPEAFGLACGLAIWEPSKKVPEAELAAETVTDPMAAPKAERDLTLVCKDSIVTSRTGRPSASRHCSRKLEATCAIRVRSCRE